MDRRLPLGEGNDDDICMRESVPKTLCVIITDDKIMCNKDEKPSDDSDLGDMTTCTDLAKEINDNDCMEFVLLFKGGKVEKYQEILEALQSKEKYLNLVSYKD